jgi:hypothetical protein
MAAVLDARRQIWRIFLMLVWRTQGGRAPLGSSFCYDLGGGVYGLFNWAWKLEGHRRRHARPLGELWEQLL